MGILNKNQYAITLLFHIRKEDNMTCENKVSYSVVTNSGFRTREHLVRCGLTDPYGMRAICDECLSDPRKMAEIQQHEDNIKADNQWAKSAGWGNFKKL